MSCQYCASPLQLSAHNCQLSMETLIRMQLLTISANRLPTNSAKLPLTNYVCEYVGLPEGLSLTVACFKPVHLQENGQHCVLGRFIKMPCEVKKSQGGVVMGKLTMWVISWALGSLLGLSLLAVVTKVSQDTRQAIGDHMKLTSLL